MYLPNKRITILTTATLLIIGGATFLYFRNNSDNQSGDQSGSETAQTTSDAPTAQADFRGGDDREPGNTLQENEGSGIIKDTDGRDAHETARPISSSSGEITIFSPSKNSVLSSGQLVSGSSSLESVSYRIIDDISGVIATGSLKVNSGKFSGKIEYETSAKEGRLDFFGTRSDLTEFSNIEIPIRFR